MSGHTHFVPLPDDDAAAVVAAAEQVAEALDGVTARRIAPGGERNAVVAAILDRHGDAALFTPPTWDAEMVAAAVDAAIAAHFPRLVPGPTDVEYVSWIAAAATAAIHAAGLPCDPGRLTDVIGATITEAQPGTD